MRIKALIIRIIRQFVRDKRTLALMLVAPLLILTMLDLVFNGEEYIPNIALINIPEPLQAQMNIDDANIKQYDSIKSANAALETRELDGYLSFDKRNPVLVLEGSDPTVNLAVMKWIQEALKPLQRADSGQELSIDYLHATSETRQFDYFGPVLLGFFAFFFVFIISGISFLRERTTGTLEKLLSSPIRKWEIVIGYVLGFGIFTIIQASLIAWYSIFVLEMMMEGSFVLLLFIIVLLTLSALTLGIFLSAFANNEFQMMQFIPIVIVPQVFFSGLFNLETVSDWLSWIGPFTPLYYAAEALRDVMVRGYGLNEVFLELIALAGFSFLFVTLNILVLRKYRSI